MSNDLFSANNKLATVMQDLGYTSTADENAFRTVLRQFADIKERDVAEAMGMMARTRTGLSDHLGLHAALFLVGNNNGSGPGSQAHIAEGGAPTCWNPHLVVDVLKVSRPQLSWQRIGEALDHEGFMVVDAQGFAMLNSMFARALGERQMPLSILVGRLWANTAGQVSLLQHAISAPPELFTFEASEHRQAPMEALVLQNRSPIGSPNHAWLSLDLVQRLCQLGEAGHLVAVRGLLEGPATGCPELLLTATAAVHTEYQLLQREVFAALLPMVLRGSTRAAGAVMARLWSVNKPLVLEALVEYYGQDCANIARVLDMCTELGVLHTVLDSTPYPFCLELAVLASRVHLLNLEAWLGDHLARDSVHLVAEVLRYVDAQACAVLEGGAAADNVLPVPPDQLRALLQLLATATPTLPAELLADVKKVTAAAAKAFPALASAIGSGHTEAFAADVEDEANRTFQSIYSESQPMSDVVAMLGAFKNSVVKREQDVFACMIHNLFDEYRFFPRYPDRELLITAQLFGALVRHQLVSSITLGIALRYILDALKKPAPSKMFSFGLDALRQFAPTVSQWPQFCAHVVQVPHLRDADPALFARLEAATQQQPVLLAPTSASADGSQRASEQGTSASQSDGGPIDASSSRAVEVQDPPSRQPFAQSVDVASSTSSLSSGVPPLSVIAAAAASTANGRVSITLPVLSGGLPLATPHTQASSAQGLSLASLLLDPHGGLSRGPSGSVTGGAAAHANSGSSSSNAADPVHMVSHAPSGGVGSTPIGGSLTSSTTQLPLNAQTAAPGSGLAFGSMNNPFLSTPISSIAPTPSPHLMSGMGGSTGLGNLSSSSGVSATAASSQGLPGGSQHSNGPSLAGQGAGPVSSQSGNAPGMAFHPPGTQQQQMGVARQAAAGPASAASSAAGKLSFAPSAAEGGVPISNGTAAGFSVGAAATSAGVRAPQQFDKSMSMDEGDRLDKEGSASLAAQVAASSLMANDKPSLASLINTESLETAAEKFCAGFEAPPELVADRIHFMMNNVSALNIDTKALELRDKIYPQYADWFANYIVVKRAAQEANFHSLYITLLDKMDLKDLMRQTVRTTFYFVKVLLYSERILKESNDRALLKNLGVWLGLLTFAKNKPVMGKELELKAIITEAYQRGRLIAVLPFIQKLLDCCKDSMVFKPSNPMIAGILSMLAELHAMKGLKINNAFSIELVFKAFGLSPNDVQPTDTLKMLARERLQNPDWGVDALPQQESIQQGQGSQHTSRSLATPDGKLLAQMGGQHTILQQQQLMQAELSAAAGKLQGQGHSQHQSAGTTGSTAPNTPHRTGGSLLSNLELVRAGASQSADGTSATTVTQHPGSPGSAAAPAAPGPPATDPALFANLHACVVINPSLGVIAERLQLKRHVPAAVERAIGEIIQPVVERSVTIACYTTFELISKDFAMEPNEEGMRKAAHLMVSSLSGSLALVTCKDPLRVSLTNQLRTMLQANVEQQMLEQVVSVVVNDNLDLGCTLIERAATEKAVRDIDKSLAAAFEERAKARAAGKPFIDASPFHGRFPASLPESLAPRPGSVAGLQLRVYEDFSRIPRSAVPPPTPAMGLGGMRPGFPGDGSPGSASAAAQALLEKYLMWQQLVDASVTSKQLVDASGGVGGVTLGPDPQIELQALLLQLSPMVHDAGPGLAEEAGVMLAKRIMKHLYDGSSKLHLQFHGACLEVLAHLVGKRVPLELTALFAAAEDERKYSKEVADQLLPRRLLSLPELDSYLSKALASPSRSSAVADYAMHLLQQACSREPVITYSDVYRTLEALLTLAAGTPGQTLVSQMVESARKAVPPPLSSRSAGEIPLGVRDLKGDNPNLKENSIGLFEDWLRLLSGTHPDDKALSLFLGTLRSANVLKGDETTDRFLRTLIEIAVTHCLNSADSATAAAAAGGAGKDGGAAGGSALSFLATDALVQLVVTLVHNGGGDAFLSKLLQVLVGVIKRDADERGNSFNARPFLRIMVGLSSELSSPLDVSPAVATAAAAAGGTAAAAAADAASAASGRYLRTLGLALHQLQPLSVPGFAFAWLELVSHRSFMPKLLTSPLATGWPLYEALLVALLRFLEPHLRHADLTDSIKALYRGSLRVLLVLLHDFPEFLCEHHLALCDAIPPTCIQMRNLILSAFPRNMRLPDPFTPNLKVDLLPEIQQPPRILPDPDKLLPEPLGSQILAFLHTRLPANLPSQLLPKLYLGPAEAKAAGTSYNVPLLNALVLFVGAQAKGVNSPFHPAALEIYHRLVSDLDSEGRHLTLNAMANQLRFPNSHTYYFSCTLLTLFMEAKQEVIQEQITRTLLERLIVNRPHPWGLLITFIELIKNRRYNFWGLAFTRCAPEIENLFTSVSKSCLGSTRPEEEGGAGGGGIGGVVAGAAAIALKESLPATAVRS